MTEERLGTLVLRVVPDEDARAHACDDCRHVTVDDVTGNGYCAAFGDMRTSIVRWQNGKLLRHCPGFERHEAAASVPAVAQSEMRVGWLRRLWRWLW